MNPANTPLDVLLAEGNAREWNNKPMQPVRFADVYPLLASEDNPEKKQNATEAKNTITDAPRQIGITLDDCVLAIRQVMKEQNPADEFDDRETSVIGYLHTGNAVDSFVHDVIDILAVMQDAKANENQENAECVELVPLNISQTKVTVLRLLARLMYIVELTDDDTLFQEKLDEYQQAALTSSPSPSHPEIS